MPISIKKNQKTQLIKEVGRAPCQEWHRANRPKHI